jgi:hypothetical protein
VSALRDPLSVAREMFGDQPEIVHLADELERRRKPSTSVYAASRIKRRRATKAEMEERAQFLLAYAAEHGPVTVRGLYYQAEVAGIPGIDKTDNAYGRVQRQVLALRRAKRMPYGDIADATRWMRKPRSFDSVQDALNATAVAYRRSLWRDASEYVEIWLEKDAIAGTVYPVTSENDTPLMVTRGYCSETFAFEAIEQRGDDRRPYHVYYLGDFDRAGRDAARSLRKKLEQFGAEKSIEVVFTDLAVTAEQVGGLGLPTRRPKRTTAADKAWPHDFACELDAIPPDLLRSLVRETIERHLPADQLKILKIAEESEKDLLWDLAFQHDDEGTAP